jgi:outer membrane protein OmpA-like peptidoglycan-associated protein
MTLTPTHVLLATCALVGTAAAELRPSTDRAPAAPDFQQATPSRLVERSHAVSDHDAALAPVDMIPFHFGSASLDAIDRLQLREAATWLKNHPRYRLVLEAHTDAAGSEGFNAGLATRRALAVRDELERLGIPRDRLLLAIHGELAPRAKNPYAPANRVVVIYPTTDATRRIERKTLARGNAVRWS